MGDVIKKEENSFKILFENCEDDFDKIFEIINLSEIKTVENFHILLNNLTNHSNPLREAVAMKLEEMYAKDGIIFYDDYIKKQFLAAIIDINPNVSRSICALIKSSDKIRENIEIDIISSISSILDEISDLEQKGKFFNSKKNHAKNKKIFSLYWLLEALSCCVSEKYNSKVLEILNVTINFCDYTIREKTAKILALLDNPPCELLERVKSDQNFYVKIQVYDKMNFED